MLIAALAFAAIICLLVLRFFLYAPRGFSTLDQPPTGPLLCTHRGYGKKAGIAENTLRAFGASTKAGFLAHELDVRITRDGVPVLFHGPKLQDYSDGYGKIERILFQKAKTFNYGYYIARNHKVAHAQLLTLQDYLHKFGKQCLTNVELKRDFLDIISNLEKSVNTIVVSSGHEGRVFYSSFNLLTLLRLKWLNTRAPVGLLLEPGKFSALRLILSVILVCPDNLHLHHSFKRKKLIRKFKNRGMKIIYWTVNEPEKILELFERDADIVITDRIDLINDKRFKKFR